MKNYDRIPFRNRDIDEMTKSTDGCIGKDGRRKKKPRCRKKYGKRGGKLLKGLRIAGEVAATGAAGYGGFKLFKKFKNQ